MRRPSTTCSTRRSDPCNSNTPSTPIPPPGGGRRGREFKSPPPDQVRGGFGAGAEGLPTLFPTNVALNSLLVKGSQAVQGRRLAAHRQRQGPGHGQAEARLRDGPRPNNKRGAAKADSELAKLVAQVETGRTMPTSGMTVEQLIERYVDDRSPSWAPGAADETRRVAQHITPHVGSIAIERLRPVDVQQLHRRCAPACPRAQSAECTTSCGPPSTGPSAWTSSLRTRQPRSSGLGRKPDINPRRRPTSSA